MPRVGRWLDLQSVFPSSLKVEIGKRLSPDFDAKLFSVLSDMNKGVEYLTDYLEMSVELMLARARAKGIELYARGVSCHEPRCGTCLGKYPYHYPYLMVKSKGISTRHMRDFLRDMDFTEEQIRMFEMSMKARHMLIALYHNTVRILNYLGYTAMNLEEAKAPQPSQESAQVEG